MNGPATGSDAAATRFGLVIYDLILSDDIFLTFLLFIIIFSGLFRNVGGFRGSFFKFKLSELHMCLVL